MCGFAGIVDLERKADAQLVHCMTQSLAHRGPDGEGYYASPDGAACLGHRRLAIIDLERGEQPLSNEDGTAWVVFNGEIYNYIEVRAELERLGHRFTTCSDTEVIVHAYEEDGPGCVDRFRGMFAFAVYDERRRGILLATDRLGKKPLYYQRDGRHLRFASELKALRADSAVLTMDRTALGLYLFLGYIPPPYTVYTQIRKMRPAERIWFDANGLRVDTYWDLDYSPVSGRSEAEVLEELEETLEESVRLRLRSDVPLGVLLSGGLDSSVIAAWAASQSPITLRTFSVSFDEPQFDESCFARAVASHLSAEYIEIRLVPGDKFEATLEQVVGALDEPFAVASVVPTFLIGREICCHGKVVLSGDGGDEGFAGYSHYWNDRWIDPLHRFAFLRIAGRGVLSIWPMQRGRGPLRRLGLGDLGYGCDDVSDLASIEVDTERVAPQCETAALIESEYRPPVESDSWKRMSRLQYVDTRRLYLPGHVLVKVDRAMMMSGVEVRSPLLDHVLLEKLAQVPTSMKVQNGSSKYLLRRLAERRLPGRITSRPKQGFNLPLAEWLRGPLASFARERLLCSSDLAQLARIDTVGYLLENHCSGHVDAHPILYRLLVLSLWLEQSHPWINAV